MSITILRILLSEVQRIRVTCRKCEAVTEVDLERIDQTFSGGKCPVCHATFKHEEEPDYNALLRFAAVLKNLARLERQFTVELDFKTDE